MKKFLSINCLICFLIVVVSCKTEKNEEYKLRERRGFIAALGAITAAISAGTSVASTANSFASNSYSVMAKININNYCDKPMKNAFVYFNSGKVLDPPPPIIMPAKQESMLAVKSSSSATGTFGTVSYEIGGMRIIIMWSVPYDFNYHANWLGVGIKETHSSSDTNTMYHGTPTWFNRKEYYYDVGTVKYCLQQVCIYGTMSNNHKAKIKVDVKCNN